jgi:branched-chain amino acid transport system ATP-binding protein
MKALILENVSKSFGGIQSLLRVNLSVDVGERRGIIGPNGAGKTTLFNLISGLLPVSEGRIFLSGHEITHLAPRKRSALGLGRTFQITNLFPNLTVMENILLSLMAKDSVKFSLLRPITSYPHLFGKNREILEMWGVYQKRDIPVKSLSYGERRQLEIILALAQKPKLILLDEPTAGLSAAEREFACSMVQALPKGITLLIIEHDMDVASQIVDQVTVLHCGEKVAEGSWEQIRKDRRAQDIYLGRQQQ